MQRYRPRSRRSTVRERLGGLPQHLVAGEKRPFGPPGPRASPGRHTPRARRRDSWEQRSCPCAPSRTSSCSSLRRRSASLTGVRLTSNWRARSSSRNHVEGGSAPSRMASRSASVIASVVEPCFGTSSRYMRRFFTFVVGIASSGGFESISNCLIHIDCECSPGSDCRTVPAVWNAMDFILCASN